MEAISIFNLDGQLLQSFRSPNPLSNLSALDSLSNRILSSLDENASTPLASTLKTTYTSEAFILYSLFDAVNGLLFICVPKNASAEQSYCFLEDLRKAYLREDIFVISSYMVRKLIYIFLHV